MGSTEDVRAAGLEQLEHVLARVTPKSPLALVTQALRAGLLAAPVDGRCAVLVGEWLMRSWQMAQAMPGLPTARQAEVSYAVLILALEPWIEEGIDRAPTCTHEEIAAAWDAFHQAITDHLKASLLIWETGGEVPEASDDRATRGRSSNG